ncbi:MAG: carbohydrate ABC transporter permease [Oscillospiraceae bacterium]|nr:carbohydrate ABC transporter permease [Oscillospiraceae bacterium]
MDNQTVVKRESKTRIKVDFERTPLLQRLRMKYISVFFLQQVVWVIFRLVLLVGISYVIMFPFFARITGSFMSPADFIDTMVNLIPRQPTTETYRAIVIENEYWLAVRNTAILSGLTAVAQMFICTLVGYGFSKFKFRGNKLFFILVIFTLMVPHQTLQFSLFMRFRYFDFLDLFNLPGIYSFIQQNFLGITRAQDLSINLINTYWPLALLSLSGLAFKNGLYILIMRQFFKGVPDELEEAAYVDGAGVFKTFFTIIIPTAIPMMVTVFLFAFTWQWTDDFYTTLFTTETGPYLMPRIVQVPRSLMQSTEAIAASTMYQSAIRNTCGLLIIAPLIVVYLIGQRFLIQGIERSGVVG